MYGHVHKPNPTRWRRPGSGLGALRCRHTTGRVRSSIISAGEKRGKEALLSVTDKRVDRGGRGIGNDVAGIGRDERIRQRGDRRLNPIWGKREREGTSILTGPKVRGGRPCQCFSRVDGQTSPPTDSSIVIRFETKKVDRCSGHITPPASNSSTMPCLSYHTISYHAMKGRCNVFEPGFSFLSF